MGSDREPMSYEDYDSISGYRENCAKLLEPIILQLKMYKEHNYDYLGAIGINQSPNCSISDKMGIFMELYFEEIEKLGLKRSYMEIPVEYDENNQLDIGLKFESFIRGKLYEV